MRRQDGFSLIELMMVVAVMLLLAVLLIPVLGAARRSANESSAIAILRSIAECETAYSSRNAQRFAGDLSTLSTAGYLDNRFSSTKPVNGYLFTSGNNVGASIPNGIPITPPDGFAYSAAPNSGTEGDYNFAVATNGVVYYGNSAPSGMNGKPVTSQ